MKDLIIALELNCKTNNVIVVSGMRIIDKNMKLVNVEYIECANEILMSTKLNDNLQSAHAIPQQSTEHFRPSCLINNMLLRGGKGESGVCSSIKCFIIRLIFATLFFHSSNLRTINRHGHRWGLFFLPSHQP